MMRKSPNSKQRMNEKLHIRKRCTSSATGRVRRQKCRKTCSSVEFPKILPKRQWNVYNTQDWSMMRLLPGRGRKTAALFAPAAGRCLKLELRRKGLSDETVQSVLAEQADEETLAFEAARKYMRRLAGLEWPEFRRKLGGFLARRGFSYTTLAPVVSEVWKEIQTADAGRIHDENEE